MEMSMLNTIRSLGPIDVRNIGRDSLLRWMAFMPFLFALLFRTLVPWAREGILTELGFDLQPYYILLMSFGLIESSPVMFGVVIGFLLLDERDDQTIKALQVTPMTLNNYLSYRVLIPMFISVVLTLVTYPLAGMVPLAPGKVLLTAVLAAPLAPLYALFLVIIAKNKVQGFALMKASGSLMLLPIIAYFIPSNWQFAFGFMPTFWPAKLYWALQAGESGIWLYLVAGFLVHTFFLWLMARRFNKIMHQ
jgi:fluoroquinolone transport system permease protein